jgi:UDP-glucose 4-epimerase
MQEKGVKKLIFSSSATVYGEPEELPRAQLGWKTEKTIEEACIDSWRWQSQNPNGYQSGARLNSCH